MGFGVFDDPKPSHMCQAGSSNQARYCKQVNYYPLAGHWLCLIFGNQSKYLNSFINLKHNSCEAFKLTPKPRILFKC